MDHRQFQRGRRAPGAVIAVSVAAVLGGGAAAQQFVDGTSTRFPSPNPTEFTNQLTIGDLDGDGSLDLVFANGGNFGSPGTPQVQRVYLNDGSGVFTDVSGAALGFSGLCRGVELGDIDADGDLDLFFAQDFNRPPKLFRNDGPDMSNPVVFTDISGNLPAGNLSSSRGQFGDVDADGDLDLYITTGTTSRFTCGQYRVFINDGTGLFTDETAARLPAEFTCNNMDCIFGDIDNDFDLDIRTASTGNNNSRLFKNDGSGVFTVSPGGTPPDSSCYSYDFGDINGDGYLDLIGANGVNGNVQELLLKNDTTGRFTNVSGQLSPNPSHDDNDTKFFDYDNDGDLDLIVGRIGGPEKIYRNDGSGNFTQQSNVIQSISDSTLDVMVADLTGDGALDVVTAQGESGNYQNRFYVSNGPADTIAPWIVKTEVPDVFIGVATPVRALILDGMSSDRNFFDGGIELVWSINGAPDETAPMRHVGGQVYRGMLPALPGGASVSYFVRAADRAGNIGIGATQMVSTVFDGDVNDDGSVDFEDLIMVLSAWGPCVACPADIDGDGIVGLPDLLIIISSWTG